MKKGHEFTPNSGYANLVKPAMNLFSNAWGLFSAVVVAAAPFALIGLAAYGAFNLLTFSTVLTVAAVFLFAAWMMSGPSEPTHKMQTQNLCSPDW